MTETTFRYTATANGRRKKGVLTAQTEAAAAAVLRQAGMTPLSIIPGKPPTRARAHPAHKAGAMRRLAALTAARAPLDRALRLAGGTESAASLFADLAIAVTSGRPLSAAMGDWPADFPDAEVALIASGEATGSLPRATDAAATLMERRAAGRQAVTSALAYPAFIIIAALMAMAVFIGFAQPQFEEVLRATGAKVSATTEVFFAVSEVLRVWGGPLLGLLAGAGVIAVIAGGTSRGRAWIAGIALRVPLVGPLLRDRAMESYSGALGAMLDGGAALPDASALAARMLNAPQLISAGAAVSRAVTEGEPFSRALAVSGKFPESLIAFAEIGEETGTLAPLLDSAAQHFGTEAEARARRLAAIAAPAATAVLGLLIGAGAYLMMTAVLDVYDAAL